MGGGRAEKQTTAPERQGSRFYHWGNWALGQLGAVVVGKSLAHRAIRLILTVWDHGLRHCRSQDARSARPAKSGGSRRRERTLVLRSRPVGRIRRGWNICVRATNWMFGGQTSELATGCWGQV